MKKNIYALLVILCVFSSCKKNDDPKEMHNAAIMAKIFPDPAFRRGLLFTFDTNSDGLISEDEARIVTKINDFSIAFPAMNSELDPIYNLKGIEYFINLEILHCEYPHRWKMIDLDLSSNKELKNVVIYNGSQLKTLDISLCYNMTYLTCIATPNLTTIFVWEGFSKDDLYGCSIGSHSKFVTSTTR